MKTALLFTALAGFLILFPGHFPGWFDSGEFATASWGLGVSHATGHPAYLLMANLFTWIPFGSIAFRTSLCSVFSAVLIAWGVVHILLSFQVPLKTAFLTVLLILLHPSVALQITRTEVYAPQCGLSIALIALGLEYLKNEDVRIFWTLSLLSGFLMALQPLLTVLLLPAIVILLIFSHETRAPVLGRTLVFFLIGLGINLYLPLRALAHPVIDWDHPVTFRRFMHLLSAKDFQVFFHSPLSSAAVSDFKSGAFFMLLPRSLLSLSFVGIAILFVKRYKKEGFFLAAAFLFSALSWLAKDFYLQNPDSHAYAMLPLTLALIFFAIVSNEIEKWVVYSGSVVLSLCFVYLLMMGGYRALSSDGSEFADLLSRHLDYAPMKGEFLIGSDHWLFPINYRQFVEGRRRDVVVASAGMIRAPWYVDQVMEHYDDFPRHSIWEEVTATPKRRLLAGFLISTEENKLSNRTPFLQHCLTLGMGRDDPFEIQRSICSQVVLVAANQIATDAVGVGHAIEMIEELLGIHRTGTQCFPLRPIRVPFPLLEKSTFLPDSRAPITALGKFYLGCNEVESARRLFESSNVDVNGRLLYAAVLWTQNKPDQAIAALSAKWQYGKSEQHALDEAKDILQKLKE